MTLQRGAWFPHSIKDMVSFDFEVSWSGNWVSLNDQVNYRVTGDSFTDRAQSRRRQTVTSPFYDGTYETHSVLENIQEAFAVYVVGGDQNMVTENLLALEDFFSQTRYNLRMTIDNHRETWLCMPAEWSTDRSQVNAHNVRAIMKLTVPRFPAASFEVIA